MGSEFSDRLNVASPSSGWRERLDFESERFEFFKTRVYGVLQLVKEVKPAFASDLTTLESLRKEFYIGYSLNHPAIPRYYRHEGNRVYEEYIDGLTLAEMMASGDSRLRDEGFIGSTLRQLFEALDYLHSQGVIHRDIKPENLMITNRGDRLKIIDFGAAESAECDTTPGFTAGTLAPEQEDLHADVQTDIYQAGLVAGKLCEGLPGKKRWKSFIRKATAPRPSERFRSSREALGALSAPAKKGVWTYVAASFGILVLLSVAGGYVMRLTGEGEPEPVGETLSADSGAPLEKEDEIPEDPHMPVIVEPGRPAAATHADAAAGDAGLNLSLQKKITEYVNGCLESHMGKYMTAHIPLDEEGRVSLEYVRGFQQSYRQAYEQIMAYSDNLSAQYPQKRDMIEETAFKALESRGSVYHIRFDKYCEEKARERETTQSEPNQHP